MNNLIRSSLPATLHLGFVCLAVVYQSHTFLSSASTAGHGAIVFFILGMDDTVVNYPMCSRFLLSSNLGLSTVVFPEIPCSRKTVREKLIVDMLFAQTINFK